MRRCQCFSGNWIQFGKFWGSLLSSASMSWGRASWPKDKQWLAVPGLGLISTFVSLVVVFIRPNWYCFWHSSYYDVMFQMFPKLKHTRSFISFLPTKIISAPHMQSRVLCKKLIISEQSSYWKIAKHHKHWSKWSPTICTENNWSYGFTWGN